MVTNEEGHRKKQQKPGPSPRRRSSSSPRWHTQESRDSRGGTWEQGPLGLVPHERFIPQPQGL